MTLNSQILTGGLSPAVSLSASIPCTSSAQGAGLILSPVSATASNTFSAIFSIDNITNQSGLSNGFVSGVDDFDAYIATKSYPYSYRFR